MYFVLFNSSRPRVDSVSAQNDADVTVAAPQSATALPRQRPASSYSHRLPWSQLSRRWSAQGVIWRRLLLSCLPSLTRPPSFSMMIPSGAVEQRPRYICAITSVLRRVRHLLQAPSRRPRATSTRVAGGGALLVPAKCGGTPSRSPASCKSRPDDEWKHDPIGCKVHNRCEDSSTTFRVMVRAPLEHNDCRPHHILAEPLASRHDSGTNHHVVALVRTAGLALKNVNPLP